MKDSNKKSRHKQMRFKHTHSPQAEEFREFQRKMLEESLTEYMISEIKEKGFIRNGFRKPKKIFTRMGRIDLAIPKILHGNYIPSFLSKHSPFTIDLLEEIRYDYLAGLSLPDIASKLQNLYGLQEINEEIVGRAVREISEHSDNFLNRDLSQVYYSTIYIDASYFSFLEGHQYSKKAVCNVIGRRPDGIREVIATRVFNSEAYTNYSLFFKSLIQRGLQKPQNIVSDEHLGLKRAIRQWFPLVAWRSCIFHHLNNLGKLTGFDQEFLNQVSKALRQDNKEKIIHDVFYIIKDYQDQFPEATQLLYQSLADLINFHAGDGLEEWTQTNNLSENLNGILRERITSVRGFPTEESYYRLGGNILLDQHNQWITNQDDLIHESLANKLFSRKDQAYQQTLKGIQTQGDILSTDIRTPRILWIDHITQVVKLPDLDVSIGVLIAYACDAITGQRKPIAYEYVLTTQEEAAQRLIEKLLAHLKIDFLRLVVASLTLADQKTLFEIAFPKAQWQLDVSDFKATINHMVPRKLRDEVDKSLKNLFKSTTLSEFDLKSAQFIEEFEDKFPKAVHQFKLMLQDSKTYLNFKLPRTRITNAHQMTKKLRSELHQEIEKNKVLFSPYPELSLFDKLLRETLNKEAKTSLKKAYINPSHLLKLE